MSIKTIKMSPEMYLQTKLGNKRHTRRPVYKINEEGKKEYLKTKWISFFGWEKADLKNLKDYPSKYSVGDTLRVLNTGDHFVTKVIKNILFYLGFTKNEVFIEISSVTYERLYQISKEDAKAEGIHFEYRTEEYSQESEEAPYPLLLTYSYRNSFLNLFKNIYGHDIYTHNPVVFVYKFKLLRTK